MFASTSSGRLSISMPAQARGSSSSLGPEGNCQLPKLCTRRENKNDLMFLALLSVLLVPVSVTYQPLSCQAPYGFVDEPEQPDKAPTPFQFEMTLP
jgi:hypothetical protein